MKKFVFSLSALYGLKKTSRDRLQVEFADAQAALEDAGYRRDSLEKTLAVKTDEYEKKMKKGISVANIKDYILYFEELQRQIRSASMEVERATKAVEQKRSELIEIYMEIKALEKLYEKQYREYLVEEGKKEMKAVEDILAFSIVDKTPKNGAPSVAR